MVPAQRRVMASANVAASWSCAAMAAAAVTPAAASAAACSGVRPCCEGAAGVVTSHSKTGRNRHHTARELRHGADAAATADQDPAGAALYSVRQSPDRSGRCRGSSLAARAHRATPRRPAIRYLLLQQSPGRSAAGCGRRHRRSTGHLSQRRPGRRLLHVVPAQQRLRRPDGRHHRLGRQQRRSPDGRDYSADGRAVPHQRLRTLHQARLAGAPCMSTATTSPRPARNRPNGPDGRRERARGPNVARRHRRQAGTGPRRGPWSRHASRPVTSASGPHSSNAACTY